MENEKIHIGFVCQHYIDEKQWKTFKENTLCEIFNLFNFNGNYSIIPSTEIFENLHKLFFSIETQSYEMDKIVRTKKNMKHHSTDYNANRD